MFVFGDFPNHTPDPFHPWPAFAGSCLWKSTTGAAATVAGPTRDPAVTPRLLRLAALTGAAVTLVACGPPSMEDYVEEFTLEAQQSGLGLDAEQAACYGETAADDLGLERLRELDVDDEDRVLTDADADIMARALVACVDDAAALLFANTGRQISPEGQACLADQLTSDDIASATASSLQGEELDGTTRERFDAALIACAKVEVVALGAPGLTFALGQDGIDVTEDDARCALTRLVDELGIEKLTNAEGGTLDLEGARSLLRGLDACTDDAIDQVREQVLDDVQEAAGDEVGDDQRDCLADALDTEILVEVFAHTLVGEEPPADVAADLQARVEACD